MPCPLFLPATAGPEGQPVCQAQPACEAQPGIALAPDTLHRHCEPGYAREVCPHAAASASDAARFLIRSDRRGAIEVAWSLERDHHPVAVGTLAITAAHATGTALERQAFALASEYLLRTGKQ